jgi:hypothetical protein
MPERPSLQSWRRGLRLSVRTLMVLVLVLGGGFGWIVHRAKLQRDAVVAIEQAGGHVYYEWQLQNGQIVSNGQPRWPKWLVDRLGVDYSTGRAPMRY